MGVSRLSWESRTAAPAARVRARRDGAAAPPGRPGLGEVSATRPSTPGVWRPVLRWVTRRTLTSVLARLRNMSFCRLRTCLKSAACAALKIRCRSRRTCASCWQPLDGIPVGQVLRSVHHAQCTQIDHHGGRVARRGALTPPDPRSSVAWAWTRQRATRLTSAPLRAQTLRSGMRPVIRARPCWEGSVTRPRFPAAFRLPPFASWPSCPIPDLRSPCGRPTGGWSVPRRTWTGFPCSALVRCDRCRAPPIPRGRGAHMAGIETPTTTATSQRRALFSGAASISRSSG